MNRVLSIAVAAVAAAAILSSITYSVDQHRYAVVSGMGERDVVARPGLHFKLPAPLQTVSYLDKRLQTLDMPGNERFLTNEKKDLVVDAFVKWKIADARQYLLSGGAGGGRSGERARDGGNERVGQLVRNALTAEIAKRSVGDVLSGQRGQVAEAVRQRVAADARRLGVEVADVRLRRVDFSDQVNASLIERMRAERVRVASETRATGAAENEQIRADAERQRSVILAEAQRDAESIRGEGDARAAAIYAQSFGKNPEFYRFYRSMEAYKATFKGRNDVLVLDANSEFFKYFKGPGAGK